MVKGAESNDREHFDAIAGEYYRIVDSYPTQVGYFHTEEGKEIMRAFESAPAKRILDVGCGPGRHSVSLAKAGHTIVAIDFANSMLEETRRLSEHESMGGAVFLVQADARALPFQENVFDGAICVELIEHLPGGQSDIQVCLTEFDRVLRETGNTLILSAPLREHQEILASDPDLQVPWSVLDEDQRRIYRESPLATQNWFDREALEKSFLESGWHIDRRRYIRVLPSALIRKFPFLHALDHLLENQPGANHMAREVVYHLNRSPGIEGKGSESDPTSVDNQEVNAWHDVDLLTMKLHAQMKVESDQDGQKLEQLEEEKAGLHAQLIQQASTLEDLQRQLNELSFNIKETEGERARLNQQVLDQAMVIETLRDDLDAGNLERDLLVTQISDLKSRLEEDQSKIASLSTQLDEKAAEVEEMQEKFHVKNNEAIELSGQLAGVHAQLLSLSEDNLSLQEQAVDRNHLAFQLQSIHSSRYWKFLGKYWAIAHRLRSIRRAIKNKIPFELGKADKQAVRSAADHSISVDWSGPAACGGKYDVIVLPIIDWDFRFQRPQQLARQFARAGHRVFYLSTSFQHGNKLYAIRAEDNIYRLTLSGDPNRVIYNSIPSESELHAHEALIQSLAEAACISEAILLVQLPFWTSLAERLCNHFGWKIVYDCIDEHAGFDTNDPAMLELEPRLLEICDLALATSQVLYEKCSQLARQTLLLPNAVDFEHFTSQDHTPPEEMMDMQGPIIGYIGAISSWFDFNLLAHAVESHPDWQFVLIGSTWGAGSVRRLDRKSNVHFLGEKPYSSLPAYLEKMDVACLPFKVNQLTKATDPVKVYEYLAAGLPIVASPLPELSRFKQWVRIADTPQSFTESLELALIENSSVFQQQRRLAIQGETWRSRFESLDAAIVERFKRVSIVIPTWNNLDLTKECIESLTRTTQHPNLQIIIIDNSSQDGTQAYLQALAMDDDRARVILNEENRGFAAAINQGIAVAEGDYIILLNNDVVLTPGWLSRLIHHLEQDSTIGLIGPTTNGAWNEAKVEAGYSEIDGLDEFAFRQSRQFSGQVAPISMLAMYCIVGRKEIFDVVGPLDERFEIGMFEDDDYALRIRADGYRLVCARDVYIHHYGRSGFKKMGERTYQRLFSKNRKRFEEKWVINWKRHSPSDLDVAMSNLEELQSILESHSDAQDVLIIPPTVGWDIPLFQRPHQLAKAFAKKGMLVFFCEETASPHSFEEITENLFLARVSPQTFEWIDSPIVLALPYNRDFSLRLRSPRIIYDVIDALEVFPGDLGYHRKSHDEWLRKADVVSVTAGGLLKEVSQIRPDAVYCPNGVDDKHFSEQNTELGNHGNSEIMKLKSDGYPIFGYHGALAKWFDYGLVRKVSQEHPDWHFVLIGPDHDGSLKRSRLGKLSNVHWLGPVPYTLLPRYTQIFDVGIIPFLINQITDVTSPLKLYEYLAVGIPVVTTEMPECEGIPGVFVASGQEDFDRGLSWGLAVKDDQERIAKAQDFARENTWEARADILLDAVLQANKSEDTKNPINFKGFI